MTARAEFGHEPRSDTKVASTIGPSRYSVISRSIDLVPFPAQLFCIATPVQKTDECFVLQNSRSVRS